MEGEPGWEENEVGIIRGSAKINKDKHLICKSYIAHPWEEAVGMILVYTC